MPGETLPRLRFLIDTNVFIALEPFAGRVEPGFQPAAQLIRLVGSQGHRIFVHPATRDDLLEGSDAVRRAQRVAELSKFEMLAESPVPKALTDLVGTSAPGSNDERDLRLITALHAHAATYLISDDERMRKRAARAGLGDAVLTLAEAASLLAGFEPTITAPPPRVETIPSYALDVEQPIFDGLRGDYAGFDDWLNRVRADPDNRDCLVVRAGDGGYEALCLLKRLEDECAYDFEEPVSKITTFKVAEAGTGNRYGELLLKALLPMLRERGAATTYVEVLPKHSDVVDFFTDFGFAITEHRSARGEYVLAKSLRPPTPTPDMPPLEFHIQYGPPALLRSGSMYLVPIQPRWHEQLFPDAPAAQPTLPGISVGRGQTHPWGNALRKAYLCNSMSHPMCEGDMVLFYRSTDTQGVTAAGVVERSFRSASVDEVLTVVGRRTVYTPAEIDEMSRRGNGVLVIVFRQDRFIDPPWTRAELQQQGVVRTWPQSITQVRGAGREWVWDQLAE